MRENRMTIGESLGLETLFSELAHYPVNEHATRDSDGRWRQVSAIYRDDSEDEFLDEISPE